VLVRVWSLAVAALRWLSVATGACAGAGVGCALSTIGFGGPFVFWRFRWMLGEDEYCEKKQPLHGGLIVTQKYLLTSYNYCNTVMGIGRLNPMANVLSKDKQISVIGALAEGSSIRSIERITGETDNPQKPVRHVTVLHLHPIKSAQDAVRAIILQEARNLEPES